MFIKILTSLVLITSCLSVLAETKLLKVMSDQKRFTISNDEGLSAGQKVLLVSPQNSSKAVAEIVQCKVKSCLVKMTNANPKFVLGSDNKIQILRGKRKIAVALSLDNALGTTYGVAGYYNFPHAPYMAGFKFRQVSNETSDIKLSGQIFSLELQRYLWSKSRFQIWATTELGMMNFTMDLSKINSSEPDIKKTEYFGTLGLEGRINISDRWRIVAGGGLLVNTIEKSYEGSTGEYDLQFENVYMTAKVGAMYFF